VGTGSAVEACCALIVATGAAGIARHVDIRERNGRFEDVPWARMDARPGDALAFGQNSVRGLPDNGPHGLTAFVS